MTSIQVGPNCNSNPEHITTQLVNLSGCLVFVVALMQINRNSVVLVESEISKFHWAQSYCICLSAYELISITQQPRNVSMKH